MSSPEIRSRMAAAGAAGSRSRPWRASRSPRERSGKLPESGDLHSAYTGHAVAETANLSVLPGTGQSGQPGSGDGETK